MVRFALLGCAALGLALSTPVLAEDMEGPATLAADAVPARAKVKRAPRKVALLPPARPTVEETGTAGEAPSPAQGPGVVALTGGAAPLPPVFVPSTPTEAPAVEPAPLSSKLASISALPPLRPSFLTDPAQPARSEPEIAEVAAPSAAMRVVLPPHRPAFTALQEPVQTGALQDPQPVPIPEPQPQQARSLFGALFGAPAQPLAAGPAEEPTIRTGRDFLDQRIAYHARLNAVPAALVHRVVVRESKYNPRAVGRGGALGLMQIKHATARSLGYDGPAMGLLDAETNLTYAVKYLAGAYRIADGSFDRAVQNYARGYYYEAKRRSGRVAFRHRKDRLQRQADAAAALQDLEPAAAPAPRSLFGAR